MLETMTIRCDQCGHENNSQYRFCGMCGAPLALPPVERKPMPSFTPAPRPDLRPAVRNDPPRPAIRPAAPPPQEAWPVSGPSFLGLADEPAASSRNVDYLLDDEAPRRTYGRAILVLFILIAFGALLYYHWMGEGVSLSQLWNKVNPQSAAPAAQPTPAATSPAPEAPPPDAQGQPHAATVTEPDQSAQPAGNSAAPPPSGQSAAAPVAKAEIPKTETAKTETPKTEAAPAGEASTDNRDQDQGKDKNNETEATPGEASAPAAAASRGGRKPTPAASAPVAASIPAPSADDRLASEGERYLYGTGVPQNCDRAQRSLTQAAHGGSAKAFTLLGAMYATGHCATRDLPTSYRWFARALHQEPSNTRLEKNLEVIWRQMTPEERQIATRQ